MRLFVGITMLCLALIAASAARAKNVDLATLPGRDTVQLTIYNSEDITLVKETRYLTFKRGPNKLQFSWAGTLIDPTSVEFRALDHSSDIDLEDTVLSAQKPQALVWNILSRHEGQVKVEISYFTSGLTWKMDYVAVCNPGETGMRFKGYVRVFNRSGEDYENAEVRLIVGTINLVEKIADLARQYGRAVPKLETERYKEYRNRAALESFGKAGFRESAKRAGRAPKQVVKEGLSEYFMFTVEGTETVRTGWSKRMRAVKADTVRFDVRYRLRVYQYGPRPVRFFLWRNDPEHGLGDAPLPDGKVRVFRENGRQGLSYLGEKVLRYVPIAAPIEVNLGTDDLVVWETQKSKTSRYNFTFHRNRVVGWDEKQAWTGLVRNYRGKPVVMDLRLQFNGDVEFDTSVDTTSFDYRTVASTLTVEGRGRMPYPFLLELHRGRNQRQNRVKVKD